MEGVILVSGGVCVDAVEPGARSCCRCGTGTFRIWTLRTPWSGFPVSVACYYHEWVKKLKDVTHLGSDVVLTARIKPIEESCEDVVAIVNLLENSLAARSKADASALMGLATGMAKTPIWSTRLMVF